MTACPSWCDNTHVDGEAHRGVVGRASVGDKRVSVIISQAPRGRPSVMLSGPVIMEINDLDHEDMATLLTLAGQPALATLVRRASQVLKDVPAHVA